MNPEIVIKISLGEGGATMGAAAAGQAPTPMDIFGAGQITTTSAPMPSASMGMGQALGGGAQAAPSPEGVMGAGTAGMDGGATPSPTSDVGTQAGTVGLPEPVPLDEIEQLGSGGMSPGATGGSTAGTPPSPMPLEDLEGDDQE